MTTRVKGKTKATGAKGKTKATDLKEFLSDLATDPRKLGEFLHTPEVVMSATNLSEADKTALRSGVSGMVAARLAGVPPDQETPKPAQIGQSPKPPRKPSPAPPQIGPSPAPPRKPSPAPPQIGPSPAPPRKPSPAPPQIGQSPKPHKPADSPAGVLCRSSCINRSY